MIARSSIGGKLGPVFRRKRFIIGVALAGLVVAVLVSFCLPREYEATARVRVIDNQGLYREYGRELGGSGGTDRVASRLLADAASTAALQTAVRRLGLDKDLLDTPEPERSESLEERIRELQEGTVVDLGPPSGGSRLLKITTRSVDPHAAQRLAIELACGLQARNRVPMNGAEVSQLRLLRQELSTTRKQHVQATEALAKFVETHAKHRLGEDDDTGVRLRAEKKRLDGVLKEISALEKQLVSVRAQLEDESEWLDEGEAPDGGSGLRKRNPTHVELKKSELEVLSALTVSNQVKADYEKRVEVLEVRMAEFPALQREWTERKAELSKLSTKLEDLAEREQADSDAWLTKIAAETVVLEIVEAPDLPERPLEPRRAVFWGAGLLVGLGLGVGTILVLRSFDRSFATAGDLASATDVPMLGAISRIETVGEMASGRRRDRMARGVVILMFLLAAGAVFLHLNYDAEMSSLVGDALKIVK